MIKEQQNNPLHGLKLEVLLTELVEFYGWEILSTALRFHCFKTNPSIDGSLKFLRKTEWARVKLEDFYLYRFKRMPKPDPQEYELAPRERGFAPGLVERDPMILTVESIELSQAKAASNFKAKTEQHAKDKVSHKREHGTERNSNHKANKPEPLYDPSNPWGKLK
ncbi:conserved hypothetical protein [Psychromonas ingrahamii 37]|uniref:DNA-binding protein VF530 n=1 Tax=Psychromonas ingrahamii (strain DSM 17664 / CCUG 51855 / 37) TaxID=357804 RepID=A1SVL2_PSYIN|nr:VF530 family DNA-binding protein [Psychromonas ingrahamii]ABM03527.1 conserved hypothetical protein [Psychromonas ingrahamii 37]